MVEDVPGMDGVFFTGYPFYALFANGAIALTPTISTFVEDLRVITSRLLKLPEDTSGYNFGKEWPCGSCQDSGGIPATLTNISKYCLSCTVTPLRPRDLYRTLPDVDTFILLEEPTPDLEALLSSKLEDEGMRYCESDITASFRDAQTFMEGVEDVSLPVDLHVIKTADYLAACQLMQEAPGTFPEIPTNTLFLRWHERLVNIGYDLVFSATPLGNMHPDVRTAMFMARQAVAETFQLEQIAAQLDPRMQELIEGNDGVRRALTDRLTVSRTNL